MSDEENNIISETARSVEKLLKFIYSSFVFRDLIYISAGLIMLSVPIKAYELSDDIFKNGWYIAGLIIVAHLVGLITSEFMVLSGIMKMYPSDGQLNEEQQFVKNEVEFLKNFAFVQKKGDSDIVTQLLRIISLKHIFAATGGASLVAAALIVLYCFFAKLISCWSAWQCGGIAIGLFAYFLVCIYTNHRKAAVQRELLKQWIEQNYGRKYE